MTVAAWVTMLLAWSVITFFTVRFFWSLVRKGNSEKQGDDRGSSG